VPSPFRTNSLGGLESVVQRSRSMRERQSIRGNVEPWRPKQSVRLAGTRRRGPLPLGVFIRGLAALAGGQLAYVATAWLWIVSLSA
jgi:hypothetical protein